MAAALGIKTDFLFRWFWRLIINILPIRITFKMDDTVHPRNRGIISRLKFTVARLQHVQKVL